MAILVRPILVFRRNRADHEFGAEGFVLPDDRLHLNEIDHAGDLRIWCTLNDEVVQDSRTSDLIFSPAELVSYVSTFTTLRPGDLILTGTPAGVGHARTPPRFIGADDVVTVAVEGIGECRNRFTKVPS